MGDVRNSERSAAAAGADPPILDEAFLFKKQIDSQTYERQRDKLREDVALARIELEDARLDEIDVEGILGFAEHVLGNAARLWMNASLAGC